MADASDNGGVPGVDAQTPSLSILAQYVKDLSFENPDAPNSLRQREKPPGINIGINVTANQLTTTDIEVELRIEARAADVEKTIFAAELVYAGVFRIVNVPQEQMHPLVMIECPRLLFPFARHIIADATREGGFPPLMVDPVDFAALYRQRMTQMQNAPEQIRPS